MGTPTITERSVVTSQGLTPVNSPDEYHLVMQGVRLSSNLSGSVTFTTPTGWTLLGSVYASTYAVCAAVWGKDGNTSTSSIFFRINTPHTEYTRMGYYTIANTESTYAALATRNPVNTTSALCSPSNTATRSMIGVHHMADSIPDDYTYTCAGVTPANNSSASGSTGDYTNFMWDETTATSNTFSASWTGFNQACCIALTFEYKPPLTRDGVDGPSKVDNVAAWTSVDGA